MYPTKIAIRTKASVAGSKHGPFRENIALEGAGKGRPHTPTCSFSRRDMACSVAGITSDANVLTNELRLIAQRYGREEQDGRLTSWLGLSKENSG